MFAGWALDPTDATATAGAAGVQYRPSADCTLYAVWGTVYTVTFDANRETGTGSIAGAMTTTPGTAITLPAVGLTVTDKAFVEWNTLADGTGTGYNVGDSYTPAGNETLYAIWASTITAPTVGAVNAGASNTGDGTATAALNGTAIEITVTAGGTPFANGDTFTVALTAPTGGTLLTAVGGTAVNSVTITYDGTNWSASAASVYATSESGANATYTVAIA